MDISQNYSAILKKVSKFPNAFLVAVVKNQSAENIQKVIDSGSKIIAFGKVQEAEEKLPLLNFSGDTHFIGRLQKNKVKKAILLFRCIQSVDSVALAEKISNESKKEERKTDILLQINIADDPNKTGFSPTEIKKMLSDLKKLSHICIRGIMTIGRQNIPQKETMKEFQKTKRLFDELKNSFGEEFTEISMGMSDSYEIALQEGATMVRVGEYLFEER